MQIFRRENCAPFKAPGAARRDGFVHRFDRNRCCLSKTNLKRETELLADATTIAVIRFYRSFHITSRHERNIGRDVPDKIAISKPINRSLLRLTVNGNFILRLIAARLNAAAMSKRATRTSIEIFARSRIDTRLHRAEKGRARIRVGVRAQFA